MVDLQVYKQDIIPDLEILIYRLVEIIYYLNNLKNLEYIFSENQF